MDLDLPHLDPHPDPARTAASVVIAALVAVVLAAAACEVVPKSDAGGMLLAIKQVRAP